MLHEAEATFSDDNIDKLGALDNARSSLLAAVPEEFCKRWSLYLLALRRTESELPRK